MGIPAYFSHIVKNYPDILKKINNKMVINNLLLDSNSIIYDVIRDTPYSKSDKNFEKKIIDKICLKIQHYVKTISPNNLVIIAFDGVAPVAKLEQQRTRRYKTSFQKKLDKNILKETKESWDTTAITPGTKFMLLLSKKIKIFFSSPSKFNVKQIIVSDSNNAGEGEHKLFEHIRENKKNYEIEKTVIYGLDADLIMLSINHLNITKNLFLFRETPEFIKSINKSLDPNSEYILDIPLLAKEIINKLNDYQNINTKQQKNRLYDYIFIMFMLGNDFMPHFPSLNIRTDGIDRLIDAYQNTIGNKDINITDGKIIYWKNFRLLIDYLQKDELYFLECEYNKRDKQSKRVRFNNHEEKLLFLPLLDRNKEYYINPFEDYWQERYYKQLFYIEPTESNIKNICLNFLEAIEWTFKYYTHKCPDWRWHYKYNYPPLLQDLIKYIPYFQIDFIEDKPKNPVSSSVQLAYVLPKESLSLINNNISEKLIREKPEWYNTDCRFEWSFCKYFWESHVLLPNIDLNQLEQFVN